MTTKGEADGPTRAPGRGCKLHRWLSQARRRSSHMRALLVSFSAVLQAATLSHHPSKESTAGASQNRKAWQSWTREARTADGTRTLNRQALNVDMLRLKHVQPGSIPRAPRSRGECCSRLALSLFLSLSLFGPGRRSRFCTAECNSRMMDISREPERCANRERSDERRNVKQPKPSKTSGADTARHTCTRPQSKLGEVRRRARPRSQHARRRD